MRAENVHGPDRLQFAGHVRIRHFPGSSHRSGDATADEAESEPADLGDFAIEELHCLRQRVLEKRGVVDVSIRAEPNRR